MCVCVCLGDSLRDVVGHVVCACVIAGFVFCVCVCVLLVEVVWCCAECCWSGAWV